MMEFLKENFFYGIIIILIVLLLISGYYNFAMIRILNSVERMVNESILGELEESKYDESRLSRLEGSMHSFLCQGALKKHQMEEEREHIRELIGNISHQTKTPIANMRLYSQLLLEEELEEGTARLARQVERQTKKLEFLIGNLIKVSRLENNLLQFQMGSYSVFELLKTLQESFESRAKEKGITLEIVGNSQLVLRCDKKWTLEALENIVDNAVKYTEKGGKIELFVKETPMFAIVCIKDNGTGIKEEELGKIFMRFYRSMESIHQEGVGIGLYLARKIIASQGGYIKVISKYKEGSVFQVGFQIY